MTAKPKSVNADIMHDIEAKHFGRCIDQVWGAGRRTLIELMDYPKARCQVVVVKQYDAPVGKSPSGKWPDLTSCYVYVPIEDDSNTWTGLNEALTKFEAEKAAEKAAAI